MITFAIIFSLITGLAFAGKAYDKTRKDLITAATKEAKQRADSGYHYTIYGGSWLLMNSVLWWAIMY